MLYFPLKEQLKPSQLKKVERKFSEIKPGDNCSYICSNVRNCKIEPEKQNKKQNKNNNNNKTKKHPGYLRLILEKESVEIICCHEITQQFKKLSNRA